MNQPEEQEAVLNYLFRQKKAAKETQEVRISCERRSKNEKRISMKNFAE